MIDPIDGTRSFILGQMHWATLIALHDGDGVVVGVAHQPYVGESFLATAGGRREWRRGGERRTLDDAPLPRLSLTPSSPAPTPGCSVPPASAPHSTGSRDRARLTRWGGDCYAYCLLAMGLIDIVIEASLQAYDVQALMPIVSQAGGAMTTWRGRALRRRGLRRRLRRSCACTPRYSPCWPRPAG